MNLTVLLKHPGVPEWQPQRCAVGQVILAEYLAATANVFYLL